MACSQSTAQSLSPVVSAQLSRCREMSVAIEDPNGKPTLDPEFVKNMVRTFNDSDEHGYGVPPQGVPS